VRERAPAAIDRLLQAGQSHRRVTALVGAGTAAVAAGTVIAMRFPGHPYADVLGDDRPYRVSTLEDLRDDGEALAIVQRELLAEWGKFGPRDVDEMRLMLKNAGRLIFVVRFFEGDELGPPSGVLQTGLAEAAGDPERLLDVYPSFNEITGNGTWDRTPAMHGDTALLLQITAFGDRSQGVGGLLRDTALHMLPSSVKFALTTTPVPQGFDLSSDAESSPATRFHFRGGARPAGFAPGFKLSSPSRAAVPAGRQSNADVVFMRYTRDSEGAWQGVKRPEMRLRHHPIDFPVRMRPMRPRVPRRGTDRDRAAA
jgi:hypothetical protein